MRLWIAEKPSVASDIVKALAAASPGMMAMPNPPPTL